MIAPVTLHVGFRRIAHTAKDLDTQVRSCHSVFGGNHLQHIGLHTAFLALGLQPGYVVQQQLCGLLPGGDVGHIVLQNLEMTDGLAERLALLHVTHRIFQHTVDGAQALGTHHDALVVEGRQDAVPGLAGLAQHILVRHEHVLVMHLAGTHGAHAELGQQG